MKNKLLFPAFVVVLLLLLIPSCVFANGVSSPTAGKSAESVDIEDTEDLQGWVEKDGDVYYYEDGTPLVGSQKLFGYEYYFGPTGIMQTGVTYVSGMFHYYDSHGHKLSLKDIINGFRCQPKDEEFIIYDSIHRFAMKPILCGNGSDYQKRFL